MQEDYDRNTLKILSKAAENSDTGVLTGAWQRWNAQVGITRLQGFYKLEAC